MWICCSFFILNQICRQPKGKGAEDRGGSLRYLMILIVNTCQQTISLKQGLHHYQKILKSAAMLLSKIGLPY